MRTTQAYTVLALHQDAPPQRIGIIARSHADALTTARELFPNRLIHTAMLDTDWDEPEPA